MGKKIFLVPPYASTLLLVHCWVASLTLAMSSTSWADEYALLALKAHITNDPNNILATNWSNITFYCNWTGVSCNTPQQRVIALNLSSMGLEGTIAPQVGNLSFLISLDISNNNFRGRLPAEIGKLHRLQILSVQDNQLSSQIPSGLDKCGDLRQISLSYNRFTGIVPRGIGNLSKLEELYLSQNNLTGEIPKSLFSITSLKIFHIEGNRFSGTLPTGMCYTLPRLQFINFSYNQLEGEIPSSLSHCRELQVLFLASNQFTGSIPKEIGNLSMLKEIYLGNNNLTEYGSGGIVSTRGDVYSYGIMLMETFTRKKPTDDMFFRELSLKSWVESLASTVMEVVDANLLRREDEHFATKENCVLSIMALALECTTESLEQRITMKEVVARLKKIRIKLLV